MRARLRRALHPPPCPRSRYGWFWECPNGGDKCQYRHALPPGYVLKSEVKEVVDTTELLEDRIERERRALTTRTPVTLERLQLWLKNKQERKAEQEAQVMEEAKESYKKGKRPVISGRALFAIDPSLFIDDDAAGEGALEREESDDDEDEGERKAVDFTPLSGPELTRTPRGLCRVRTRHAYHPPALGTYRMRRAACPQGPAYCTYGVRVPASGVGYVQRTVAPQVPPVYCPLFNTPGRAPPPRSTPR